MPTQEQALAEPAEQRSEAGAAKTATTSPSEKENRPGDGRPGAEKAQDGSETAHDDSASAGGAPPPQDESPFAAISASMGWDTFHLVSTEAWLHVFQVLLFFDE